MCATLQRQLCSILAAPPPGPPIAGRNGHWSLPRCLLFAGKLSSHGEERVASFWLISLHVEAQG